ncbi:MULTISPECIES: DNA topoisomerase I [Methanothermobacter]|uniref:DNA topoisomerase 1 n=1 Tax=Methanothermobacter defluvii TaxID=49339 RepID=A0A371NBA7_9EURY|nr:MULTISPECIES: DNA topoisomerase I [Methanothermobacter]REE26321.1 DNA topoisomerase I [Methanothermobacter defluvii]WBF07906.1 DNA topoisomerase I [Methanothermobacter thermautotrophicus]
MHEVIICEKPKSSEKIAGALFPDAMKKKHGKVSYWEHVEGDKRVTIVSAVGHLYSLRPRQSNEEHFFDLEWAPIYEIDKKKGYVKDYLNVIRKFAAGADRYIHACDYDIEGTLIGFNALKYGCGEEALRKTSRMKFSTLTREEIKRAYQNPIEVDYGQVDSGAARHILDFIFGVNISRSLMKSVKAATNRFIKLSAGRVQTPTLAILVEREKEIRDFKPVPYWIIRAELGEGIIAESKRGKIFKRELVDSILEKCQGSDAEVKDVRVRDTIRKPPVPFDLGTLQSEAYRVFGFSPKKTQTIAQNLYTEGYTSYPRTSSQKLPESIGYEKILKNLAKNPRFGVHIERLRGPLKPHEGKKEDDAHPAIHPTGLLPSELSKDEKKVYDLIVHRFISVFGEDAILQTMKVELEIGEEEFSFSRKRVSKAGWMESYPYTKMEDEEFPEISGGDSLAVRSVSADERETKPPARYNEASLIRELERRGLGTKSTRADIIAKLYDRKYIEGKKIRVSPLGENIIDTLTRYCEKITSEELTRQFERELEDIMRGKISKDRVIDEAITEVRSILSDIEENLRDIGKELYRAYQDSRVVGECPACGGKLVIKYSPRNRSTFVGCSSYPDCRTVYSLPKGASVLKSLCEKCGLPMISYGRPRQRACLDPKCGKKKSEVEEVVGKCPECGSDLIKRSGRYGEFVGCKGFPKCRFTCSVDEVPEG